MSMQYDTSRKPVSMRYQNPVWPGYFADPFVLRTEEGEYFAYGTAEPGEDRRLFPMLRSSDLVHWEALGGALEPLRDPPAVTYWAPEVAAANGQYFLFYSASTSTSDEHHRIRVAIADHPAGPFHDSGQILIPQLGFTIDASPFFDPVRKQWYLFFATDYESDEPTGTGLGVVRLCDSMTGVIGEPRIVTRATASWQVYERNRNYKGKVWPAWHCVEGPFALFHEGKYFCLYSAGAWHGDNYGVGFCVADDPMGPWRDEFALNGPSVLKGIPEQVVGPGHNSAVLAPDGKTLMMVYHAWDAAHTARRMCIDPIRWINGNPVVDGPSTQPREV